jgi:hypothetical protein
VCGVASIVYSFDRTQCCSCAQKKIGDMLAEKQKATNYFGDDESFNKLYPRHIRTKAARHWTPLDVARRASEFLCVKENVHILDIGSGVGKFCLAGAHHKPEALFYGVEQRRNLVEYADRCNMVLSLSNVSFIHANFTQLDFRQFDHYYFYNSFYENLEGNDKIDLTVEHSLALYNYYNRYLYTQLAQRPKGTRVATFHCFEDHMPPGYYVVDTAFNGFLKLWIKV